MCEQSYDMTYTDLNPKFLYACEQDRIEANDLHTHDFVEIILILRGKAWFEIEGHEYEAEEGTVVVVNPGMHHRSLLKPEKTGNSRPAREFHLAFTGVEFVNCRKGCLPLFRGCQITAVLPEETRRELFELCAAIEHEAGGSAPGRYFMLKAYQIQVLCLLERFRRQEIQLEDVQNHKTSVRCEFKSINKKYVIRRIMDYMENHYQEKISLDQIAANMYLSSYYISKLFKSETGDTPINYLISLRMKKARDLLEETPERPVQEIAAAVGYEDAYHFSKQFKKYYGMPPLYYKARLR